MWERLASSEGNKTQGLRGLLLLPTLPYGSEAWSVQSLAYQRYARQLNGIELNGMADTVLGEANIPSNPTLLGKAQLRWTVVM